MSRRGYGREFRISGRRLEIAQNAGLLVSRLALDLSANSAEIVGYS
jgi:hypothetical protein